MDVYTVNVSSLNKSFEMDINVIKVEKPQLMTLKKPGYKSLLGRHPHLEGVVMDDNDTKTNLPVHLILGISECTRIKYSRTAAHRWRMGSSGYTHQAGMDYYLTWAGV
jgi:hypothetical protein